eukprot:364786-Chlamydomonas_euryale.AAC.24
MRACGGPASDSVWRRHTKFNWSRPHTADLTALALRRSGSRARHSLPTRSANPDTRRSCPRMVSDR